MPCSDAGTGGPGGATAPPPIFGRLVNPIVFQPGRADYPHLSVLALVFHLPASLPWGQIIVICIIS